MADTTKTTGSTGTDHKLVDLANTDLYANAVVPSNGRFAEDESVLAAASGSAGGLGKVGTVPDDGWMYIRCDCTGGSYKYLDWRIKSTKQYDMQLYKSRTIEDEVTLTFASFADTETFVLNGLTYTGEATSTDAAYASRKIDVSGADAADATAAAALINADFAVVPDGSVAVAETLVLVTDQDTYTLTAAASADYENSKFDQSGNQAAELASIVLAINHKDNVTCASSVDDDTVTINGLVFTSAAAEDKTAREFDNDSSDNDTATSLAACINDSTYGVDGLTAVAAANVVSLTRDTVDDTVTMTSSSATTLAVETAGGVPGVVAAATGATGELSITPVWATITSVTGDTGITVTDIDCPGVYATVADAVVTLVPGTPVSTSTGELATTIHAVDASAHVTVSTAATLAGLIKHGAGDADEAANNTTAGTIYEQNVDGYEYCYLAVMNDSGDASVATMVVGATLRV